MIMFLSATGKPPGVEALEKDIDVMLTFFDVFEREPLPKFQALYATRLAKKSKPKKRKKTK